VTLANPALAKLDKNVSPLADGATELIVEYGGRAALVPVRSDAKADRPSVSTDVMPVFACRLQYRSCHGPPQGRLPPVAVRLTPTAITIA
jgi:hypothetical protein